MGLELSPRAGRLFSSVDLKKFLDFLFLTSYSSFFFFPYLFPCIPGLKNGAFCKKTMAVSYKKKKKGSEIRFPAQRNVARPPFCLLIRTRRVYS